MSEFLVTETITTKKCRCDFCPSDYRIARCHAPGCGKDICPCHSRYFDENPHRDYPEFRVCPVCAPAFEIASREVRRRIEAAYIDYRSEVLAAVSLLIYRAEPPSDEASSPSPDPECSR